MDERLRLVVASSGGSLLLCKAMQTGAAQNLQESHGMLRTKIRRSRQFRRNLLMCKTNWWRARQESNPRPPGS
jgi:hypothetical protein